MLSFQRLLALFICFLLHVFLHAKRQSSNQALQPPFCKHLRSITQIYSSTPFIYTQTIVYESLRSLLQTINEYQRGMRKNITLHVFK